MTHLFLCLFALLFSFSNSALATTQTIPDKVASNKSGTTPSTSIDTTVFNLPKVDASLDSLQQLAKQLSSHPTLRANFQQTKKIAMLKRPLVSTGQMLFSETQGLYWQTNKPFNSALKLTEKGLTQKDDKGIWQPIDKDSPQTQEITQIFLALLRGDVDTLSQSFILHYKSQDTGWELGLEPIQPLLKNIMSKILLKGDTEIKEVITWESSGDITQIFFSQIVFLPNFLLPNEKFYFSEH